jgi:carboxypeptidase Taq
MDAYDELLERLKDIDIIGQIGGLVGWDQEVLMPPKAAALRAEQLSWISKTGHVRLTDPRIGELLEELESGNGLDEVQAANVRLARESYDKATKLPTEFVAEMAKHRSKAQISWTEARAKDDFSIFRDDLAKDTIAWRIGNNSSEIGYLQKLGNTAKVLCFTLEDSGRSFEAVLQASR